MIRPLECAWPSNRCRSHVRDPPEYSGTVVPSAERGKALPWSCYCAGLSVDEDRGGARCLGAISDARLEVCDGMDDERIAGSRRRLNRHAGVTSVYEMRRQHRRQRQRCIATEACILLT